MSTPTPEPSWVFEHADRAGATFRVAPGLVQLSDATGAISLHLSGPQAWPVDPLAVALAISEALGRQVMAVPTVDTGYVIEPDPLRVRFDDFDLTLTVDETRRIAGQGGHALLTLALQQRQSSEAEVQATAAKIEGVPWEQIPASRRASAEAAARRVLGIA